MKDNQNIVTGEDASGKKIKLMIIRPNQRVLQEAQRVYNLEMSDLIRQAAISEKRLLMKSELGDYLAQLGIWTKDDAKRFFALQVEIRDLELKLRKGGMKLSEGRQIAIHMAALRQELWVLYSQRSQFDSITIEATSENKKFDFLASRCIMNADTKMPFFTDLDDYLDKADWPVVIQAAQTLAAMMYGLDPNADKKVPEQQWLKEFNFVDDDGNLINKEGKKIDTNGYLINEKGQFINEDGKLVDVEGNLVDEEGNYAEEPKPFLDDDTGEPIAKKKVDKKKSKNKNKKKEN